MIFNKGEDNMGYIAYLYAKYTKKFYKMLGRNKH